MAAPRAADWHVEVKKFDIGRDPQCDTAIVGPDNLLSLNDRKIIIARIFHCFLLFEFKTVANLNYSSRSRGVKYTKARLGKPRSGFCEYSAANSGLKIQQATAES